MYVLEINTVRPQVTGFGVQEKKTAYSETALHEAGRISAKSL